MSMWAGLLGKVQYASGTSGTLTLNAGARVLQIKAANVSAGSVVIFGGATIVLPAITGGGWGFNLQENHTNLVAPTGATTIVFATTTSYYVEYVDAAGRTAPTA